MVIFQNAFSIDVKFDINGEDFNFHVFSLVFETLIKNLQYIEFYLYKLIYWMLRTQTLLLYHQLLLIIAQIANIQ